MKYPDRRIAALFVDHEGPYPRLLGVEMCWDETRDARNYEGYWPVVCHPPCQRWGSYAALNYKRWGGEHNKPGNDGGCFASALDSVRKFGGVLEHPAKSKAWGAYGLQKPVREGWNQVSKTAWVCEVWQSAYGHKAQKATWLWYESPIGFPPIDLDWTRNPGTHQIGFHDQRGKARNKPTVSRKEAIHTPLLFAQALIELASFAGHGETLQ